MAGQDANTKLLLHLNGADGLRTALTHYRCEDSDNDTTVVDNGPGGNTGTSSTNTVNLALNGKVNGPVGSGGMAFNGTSAYVSVPDHADWDLCGSLSTDYTIDFWIKYNTLAGANQSIINQRVDGSNYWAMQMSPGAVEWGFRMVVGGSNIILLEETSLSALAVDTWFHVAVCKVGSDWGLYLNGDQREYASQPSTATYAAPLEMGRASGLGRYLDGAMSEVRIQNSNVFGAAPVVGDTDTITVPSGPYTSDANTHLLMHFNNNVTDDGNTGHTPVNNGGTYIGAFQFVSSSSEYIAADGLITDIGSDATGSFAFWAMPEANANQAVWGFGETAGTDLFQCGKLNSANGNKIRFDFHDRWNWRSATDSVTTGSWIHFVVTQDGTEPKFYLNGVQDTTAFTVSTDKTAWFSNANVSGLDNFRIGCYNFNSGGNASFFDGRVDDFRYYSGYVLTQDDIDAIYNSGSGTHNSLIVDATGNHTGTISYNTAQLDTAEKRFGTASLLLDGNSDSLELPDRGDWDFGTNDFTIDYWSFRTARAGTNEFTIMRDSDGGYSAWLIDGTTAVAGDNKISMSSTGSSWDIANDVDMGGYELSQWIHWAVIRSGSLFGVYKNGIQTAYFTSSASLLPSTDTLTIGEFASTYYFAGNLDEIRIQGDNYFVAAPLPTPYAWYRLAEVASNTTVVDAGSGANNGTASTNTSNFNVQGKVTEVFSTAADFNDGDADISVPDHADWDLGNGDFTLDFRIKFKSQDANNYWFIGRNLSSNWYFQLTTGNNPTGKFYFQGTSFTATDMGDFTPILHRWYHIALVRTAGFLKVYVDGLFTGTSFNCGTTAIADTAQALRVGSHNPTYGASTYCAMDEVRVSDTARWTSNFVPPTSAYTSDANTLLLLHLDGNVTDSGNTGHTPTATNIGYGAYQFNGTSEYINVDPLEVDITSDTSGTFAFWLKPGDVTGNQWIVDIADASSQPRLQIWMGGANMTFDVIADAAGANRLRYTVTSGAVATEWAHWAWVQDGTAAKVYKDGVDVTPTPSLSGAGATTYWLNDLVTHTVGRIACSSHEGGGNLNFANAALCDFRYYQNTALTAGQVSKLYNSGDGLYTSQDKITVPTAEYSEAAAVSGSTQSIIIS
jgi:hypothetical protein